MSGRSGAAKNPRSESTSDNVTDPYEPQTKHHRAEMVQMKSLVDQLTKEVESLTTQLKESQKARDSMAMKLTTAELLSKHPDNPLMALWKALHSKKFAGPELALAIANDSRCLLGRKWCDSDLVHCNGGLRITKGARPLHLAACARRPDVVAAFLAAGADAGARDRNHATALHFAASNGDLDSVQVLLASGRANSNAVDNGHMTSLDYAAANGHMDVVQALHTYLITIGKRPLHDAVMQYNIPTLKALIRIGADVNALDYKDCTLLHQSCYPSYDAAFNTVHSGDVDCIQELLASGANCDALDNKKCTPLNLSVLLGEPEKAVELLKNGALPTLLDDSGRGPLHHAAGRGSIEIIEAFPHYYIDFPCELNFTPLHYAVRYNHREVIDALLRKGASTEIRDSNGWTILQLAVWKNNDYVASHLIEKGADVSQTFGEDKMSLLHVAAAKGYKKMVKVLLDAKADYESKCEKGYTPLHYASKGRHLAIVKALLRKGATLTPRDIHGQTPLHLLVDIGKDPIYIRRNDSPSDRSFQIPSEDTETYSDEDVLGEDGKVPQPSSENALPDINMIKKKVRKEFIIIRYLLKKGAPLDAADDSNNTPLHLAAAKHDMELAEFLTSNGADKTLKNKAGKTPLQTFATCSHLHVFSDEKYLTAHRILGVAPHDEKKK